MNSPQITLTLPPKTGEKLPEPAPVRLKMPARSPMDSEKYSALVALGVAILDRQPGEFIAGNPEVRTVLFVERSLPSSDCFPGCSTLSKRKREKFQTQKPNQKTTMARPSKLQAARQAEIKVRAEKALESVREAINRLLGKHIAGMLGGGDGSKANLEITITPDGMGAARLTYQTAVSEGVSFKLDDGQNDLPLSPATKTPGLPVTVGTSSESSEPA